MMNYVGSVSILDRGDAPARAIIDKNARSLAQRIADETKDELDKVMNRVENIYVSYEQSTQDMFATSTANVEYLEDLKELEAILTDQIKKKKYQQQVTVFIVGFENMSSQRLRLIQQVNEFFMDATRPQEDDEPLPSSPDIDMEEVAISIEESLDTAEKLADRLGELNTEMCDWLTNYAINKASTNYTDLFNVGKKKLEKALSQAKDDINSLSEKLLKVQGEMEEKDEKVGQLVKQLEAKGQDVQKFRTAAEIAKRRLEELQNQVENQKSVMTDAQRDWQKQHDQRVLALTNAHKEEMAELQTAFEEELKKSKDEIEFTRVQLEEAEKNAQLAADEADKIRQNLLELQLRGSSSESKRPVEESEDELQNAVKESRPSTKSSKQSSATKQKTTPPAKSPVKSTTVTVQQKSPTKPQKDVSESAVQDEGGDHLSAHVETRQSKRSRSTLEPVQEMEVTTEFDNQFDLKDDHSWSSVPPDQLAGRFNQYRKLSQRRVEELEEQLNIVMAKTQRKVQTLKAQFQEHKSKWESERKVLIDQVEQAQKLQTEAEKEADNAMSQLEEFINEQERLEEEEEEKRNDISKGIISRPLTRRSSPEKGKTSPTEKDKTPPTQETSHTPEAEPEPLPTEGSEQELKRLMQQTDDAKAQEMARISSGAMSAPPAVEPENQKADGKEIRKGKIKVDMETQTDPEITGEQSLTEDDVRLMSSHSRASLRSQYRNKLEETRAAIEDRRAKSPAISVPSQRSLEEDQLIEEEDDFTMTELKEETVDVGTSPPPMIPRGQSTAMSRRSAALADHPVVNEYLRAYDGVMNFKEGLSKILIDREMLQAGEIVHDLSTFQFDRETKVKPQLEKMTANVYQVLEEITHVLASIMQADREPIVSSLNGVVSRDGTKTTLPGRERSADSGRGQTMTRASNHSLSTRLMGSEVEDKQAMRELQLQYERLEQQLNDETRKHEEQLRHNTVVMMEMQDTINELQRELSALGRSSSRMRPASEASQQPPESAIMFTRLDSDRNSKIMKRAVNDEKLDVDRYKDAVNKMDSYVSLPAQRLGHLVRKYVHHCRMKEIEENVKKSRSLNENVFEILDKMEALQNQRAKRWADKMDEMGNERLRLASILMETLDSIEQESGIFLIKPMYSYRGRVNRNNVYHTPHKQRYSMGALIHQGDMKERYGSKLTRPARHRNVSPLREISSYAPAPTPASNIRGLVRSQAFIQAPEAQKQYIKMEPLRPLEGDDTGLMGSQALAYNGVTQRQTWNLSSSQVRGESTDFHSNLMNTPRILELDINRMLIGQNNISNKMAFPGYSDDRLVNAAQNNLRSYVTVNRPTVQPTTVQQRPRSYSGIKEVPPTSPVTRSATTTSAGGNKRVRLSESADVSRPSIPSTPPLPPISARDSDNADQGDNADPPGSPPGSSLRHSPQHVQEVVVSPIK